jgi:rubrerythrin
MIVTARVKNMRSPKWIYQQLVALEEQAAAIYLKMASRFSPENPELSSFWLEMGMQEKQHAGLLQFCIAEELYTQELPTDQELQETATLFENLSTRGSDPQLGVAEAFRIAAQMEASEANAIYDRLTKPVHSSMYLLRRKVASMMPDHLVHLLEEARRSNVSRDTIQELEDMASKHLSS